jgi:hypothetical protein
VNDLIADAHRGDGKRFVADADEKLTAFVELESVMNACGEMGLRAGAIFDKLGVPFKRSESGGRVTMRISRKSGLKRGHQYDITN